MNKMNVKLHERMLAFLLAFAMLFTSVPQQLFAAEETGMLAAQGQEELQDANVPEGQGEQELSGPRVQSGISRTRSIYYEVKFEMPEEFAWAAELQDILREEESEGEESEGGESVGEDSTEAESEMDEEDYQLVDLPETMMLKEGTLISTIPIPKLFGYVFLGWYYDKDLTRRAATEDVVDRNMTLYPKFGSGMEGEGEEKLNYVSEEDVPADYVMLMAVYGGLTEEEIREALILRDSGSLEEEMEYLLEFQTPDLELIIPEDEQRALVQDILDDYLNTGADTAEDGSEGAAETVEEGMEAAVPEDNEEKLEVSEETGESVEDRSGTPEETGESVEEESEETTEEENIPGWETSDGRFVDASLLEGLLLTENLLEAGLSEGQIRSLVSYYDPEEMDRLDEILLQDTLVKLGFDENDDPAEDLQVVRDAQSFLQIYRIVPKSGTWHEGMMHQAEILDTENLRFYKDGEITDSKIKYYNITVAQEEFSHMRLDDSVVDILADEVEGIDLKDGGMVKISQNEYGDMDAVRNDRSGTFRYLGSRKLSVGTLACIHAEGAAFEQSIGMSGDTEITFVKITEDLGGENYAYIMPEMEEILFSPDNIPMIDDGSFEDGEILYTFEQMKEYAPMYKEIGLAKDFEIEPGDLITMIALDEEDPENGSLTGYGLINNVAQTEEGLLISYEIISEAELEKQGGFARSMDNVPLDLSDEQMDSVIAGTLKELDENNAFEDARDYITALVMADDSEIEEAGYTQLIQQITFQTDTGEEISLEEIRALADRDGLGWDDDPKVNVAFSPILKHFGGTGIRLVINAGYGGDIKSGDKGIIRLEGKIQFEVEVAFGVTADSGTNYCAAVYFASFWCFSAFCRDQLYTVLETKCYGRGDSSVWSREGGIDHGHCSFLRKEGRFSGYGKTKLYDGCLSVW